MLRAAAWKEVSTERGEHYFWNRLKVQTVQERPKAREICFQLESLWLQMIQVSFNLLLNCCWCGQDIQLEYVRK